MSYDGWVSYNNAELVNVARTARLADALGITTLWENTGTHDWIKGGAEPSYDSIANAPWYDPAFAASGEFAGFISLGWVGMGDSSATASTSEYTGNGGRSNNERHTTLPIVVSLAIIASTDRGADYGKRWLDKMLSQAGSGSFCAGSNLHYFRHEGSASDIPPIAHYRDVRLTRGVSVTRKRKGDCSVTWFVTFTLTAGDPFEYGQPVPMVSALGSTVAAINGPRMVTKGSLVLAQQSCPAYDFSPVYDPLYPALVSPPAVPDFYPAGWGIYDGMTFMRTYATVTPAAPVALDVVPLITLNATAAYRFVRVSIWDHNSPLNDQCGPLFSVVINYLPPNQTFYVDGEQQASYLWDGVSPSVRRADSLTYSPEAKPVEWTSFADSTAFLVTVDVFADSDGYQGDGSLSVGLSTIRKSD